MTWTLLPLMGCLFAVIAAQNQPTSISACTSCKGSINGTEIWKKCENDTKLHVADRCCFNGTEVVGIDLSSCNLTEKDVVSTLKNLTSLEYLALEMNPFKHITLEDLMDKVQLSYLSLPVNVSCPGGSDVWGKITNTSTDSVCEDMVNPCNSLSCPENSHCVHFTINSTQCQCDDGYYGYKCMNEGEFPVGAFIPGLIVPTVLLSIFLYCTQRRYVVKKNQ